jgi:serine/threonine protein kinase
VQRGVWITDSIELTEPIAEGAMGRVWVGYHHRLQTHVAVKFVSDKLGEETAEAMARFEREASVVSQIKSPHVVQTFDSGRTREGVPYIVMEFLHGQSLGERLRRVGRIDLEEATTVLVHCARGLTAAHSLGIVHRDIKPDNIFMCRPEEGLLCKVLDFGIAKQTLLPAMGGLTTDGKLVGTPEYMSPEQVLEDRAVDYRADLWSLAVVMYQALTGHLPFAGATLGQLCLNLVGKTPAKPTHYRPDLPRRVDAWFARALNRDAQMRFSSAKQMAESFKTLDDDLAFHVVEVNENTERHLSSSHTLRMATRKKSTMLTAVGVAAAVAVLGGGSWLAVRPATEPIILAQEALAPAVTRIAEHAVKNAQERKVLETDDTNDTEQPATSDDKRNTKPTVPRGDTPKKPKPATAPKPEPVHEPAPAPAPSPPERRRGRTPGNTGF